MNLATANAQVKKVVSATVKANKPKLTIQAAVDQLGALKADINALQSKEKVLVKFLKDQGDGSYDGTVFHAVVFTADQDRINSEAVRELLTEKQLAKVINTITVTTCKVTALSSES